MKELGPVFTPCPDPHLPKAVSPTLVIFHRWERAQIEGALALGLAWAECLGLGGWTYSWSPSPSLGSPQQG